MALSGSEIPIIDFSKETMKRGTETWDLTCIHVRKAVEECGSFIATFNEINKELYTAVFSLLEKLFDLPKDTKRRFTSDMPLYGYSSDSPLNPLCEVMGLPDSHNSQSIHNLALLMWPQGDATFCEILNSYVARVSKLEETVRKMIFQSYGAEKHLDKESKSMKYPIGLMKYRAPMTGNDTRGMSIHYDKNFMTILQADGVGLQVQSKDGEWISPTLSSSSSLIVVMGESSFVWSNGRIRCPLHRVRMVGSKSRYSIGYFSTKEGKIEIPRELVDEQHPLLFKPFDFTTLFKLYQQQAIDKTYTQEDDNRVPIISTHFAI